MTGISLLDNPVQEYAWGSRTFIPRLLGKPSPSRAPQAELWMGAHPNGTSKVFWENRWTLLSDLIEKDPPGMLGKDTAARFCNRLPFLFKIIATSKPLSIQAHPNQEQALEGFKKEINQAIPLSAPNRNYRDPFHKPEILCALTPFWALKGFRTVNEIRSMLDRIGFPAAEVPYLQEEGKNALKKLFTSLFTMPGKKQRRLVSEMVSAAEAHASSNPAFAWMIGLHREFPYDVGVLGPLLLNLIHLKPCEALSIAAGELHCYLDGAGIEVMVNSDNVLRGGLTEKHIDIPELLEILNFSPGKKNVLHPEARRSGEWFYVEGSEEFILSRISLDHDRFYESPLNRSVEIIICVQGESEVSDIGTGDELRLSCGSSIIVPAQVRGYRIRGDGTLYKATVPLDESKGSHGS
ncbi:MAG: mannose-6-phosphate isomerase, class I [Deltaproteobacteria bacterium]|nr:mannose-6-phosphate isomerase, class I [Deltaproteobacteria bacterium]